MQLILNNNQFILNNLYIFSIIFAVILIENMNRAECIKNHLSKISKLFGVIK